MSQKLLIVLLAVVGLSACSNKEPQSELEYGQASSDGGLQVPPGLSSPGRNPVLQQTEYRGRVVPQFSGITIERDGSMRYCHIEAPIDEVWAMLISFAAVEKLVVASAESEMGLLSTEWMQNTATDKNYLLGKYFERFRQSSEKDRFSFWLERDKNDSTRVYVAHQGQIQEVRPISSSPNEDIVDFYWVPRPSQPLYELEMLRRFMVYAGSGEAEAQAVVDAERNTPQSKQLAVSEGGNVRYNGEADHAWRALTHEFARSGYTIISRDQRQRSIVLLFDRGETEQPNRVEQLLLRKKAIRRDQVAQVILNDESDGVVIRIESPEADSPLEEETLRQLTEVIVGVLNEG